MPEAKTKKVFSDDAVPEGVIVESPHLQIEEAIGSLAVLVARHATIPMVHYPELSAITEVYLERAQARGQEKDERLKAIEEERKGLLT